MRRLGRVACTLFATLLGLALSALAFSLLAWLLLVVIVRPLKEGCREIGLCSKQPQLDSWDPQDRIAAARAAAKQYGGK